MISRYRRELSVAAATGIFLLVLAALRPGFFATENLRDILVTRFSYVLVAVVGMTLVILARQIDISIGSQFAICGMVGTTLAKAGLPPVLAPAAMIATGALLGAVNGGLVGGLGLPSIVVTLAMMVTLRQGLLAATEGATVLNPPGFQWLGLGQAGGQAAIVATALGVFLLFALGMRWLAAGRAVYAVGSDAEAARLAGIRPRRVIFGVFTLMGALTGLAAALNGLQVSQANPAAGLGLELQVIAAAVVGGVAISGGRGTLAGALIGALLLSAVVGPALVFLRVEAAWEKAAQGAIILVAVASDALNLGQRKHAGASLAAH